MKNKACNRYGIFGIAKSSYPYEALSRKSWHINYRCQLVFVGLR